MNIQVSISVSSSMCSSEAACAYLLAAQHGPASRGWPHRLPRNLTLGDQHGRHVSDISAGCQRFTREVHIGVLGVHQATDGMMEGGRVDFMERLIQLSRPVCPLVRCTGYACGSASLTWSGTAGIDNDHCAGHHHQHEDECHNTSIFPHPCRDSISLLQAGRTGLHLDICSTAPHDHLGRWRLAQHRHNKLALRG